MQKLKHLLLPLITLSLLLITSAPVSAQEPDLLYGESHNYSVILRGNAESIIYDRITLTNNKDTALTQYAFEVPELNISEIVGYQIEGQKYCSQYDYSKPINGTSAAQRPCLQYSERDYDYGANASYKKLSFTGTGNKYQVMLPHAVEVGKKTVVVISYTGKGYIKKQFGLYKFNFETLKSSNRIKDINVSIDVDSDLVLDGGKSKVNYGQAGAANLARGLSDTANLGRAVDSIGYGGSIYKTAKNLAANESFSVKGKYAESAWRLHIPELLISVAVLVSAIVFVFWLSRRYMSKRDLETKKHTKTPKAKTVAGNLLGPIYIAVGLGVAVFVIVATFAVGYYLDHNTLDTAGSMIAVVITILFYVLITLGPAILLAATRKDWKTLVYVLFWIFAWLLVFAAIYQWGLKDTFDQTRDGGFSEPYYDDCRTC